MIQAQWYSIRAWQVDGTKENLERPGTWRSHRGNNGTVLGGSKSTKLSTFKISHFKIPVVHKTIQDHPLLADRHHYGWKLQCRMTVWRFRILQYSGLRFPVIICDLKAEPIIEPQSLARPAFVQGRQWKAVRGCAVQGTVDSVYSIEYKCTKFRNIQQP